MEGGREGEEMEREKDKRKRGGKERVREHTAS